MGSGRQSQMFQVKNLVLISATCLAMIGLGMYVFLVHTPSGNFVQNEVATRLRYFVAMRTDGFLEDIESQYPGLSDILSKAALPNRTILVTALNSAWAQNNSMIDLFLESFHQGEGIAHYLDHLLIVALDLPSYNRCIELHHICFRLETKGVDFSAEKFFMTGDYLKMMWRRLEFVQVVLKLGYNVLFSDADIMWFRDPFPHFYGDADFQIACDYFNGRADDINNFPNGGYTFVRSSPRTIGMYRFWHESRLFHPEAHDQDVLNMIKKSKEFGSYNVKVKFLSTANFAGYCQRASSMLDVVTMHANCCTGLERKLFDLRLTMADWRQFKALTPQQQKAKSKATWQAPRECLKSWKH